MLFRGKKETNEKDLYRLILASGIPLRPYQLTIVINVFIFSMYEFKELN